MKMLLVVFSVLFMLLQYEFWFSEGGFRTAWQLKKQIAQQEQINAQLAKRNAALLAEIKELKSGNGAVEAHARNDLGMVKKDEVFYQIIK